MYKLIVKRYRKVLVLLIILLTAGLFLEMQGGKKEQVPVEQEVFDSYLNNIKLQKENVDGIAIFGGGDSYNVKKIKKTAELYEKLEDVTLSENVNAGAGILLSDRMVYLFLILFLIFEMYVFVYDKDKGYDHLIHTLKLGNREYIRQKLGFVLLVMTGLFLVGRILKLLFVTIQFGRFFAVPVQSVEHFTHVWLNVSIYEFFWIQTIWQLLWILITGVVAALLYHLANQIWKAAISTTVLALVFLLIHINSDVEKIGLLFQLSSGYLKELCLVPIGSNPVNGMTISTVLGAVLAVLVYFVLWHYGNHVARKARGRSSENGKTRNAKAHDNFYYECRKVFVINGYWLLLVLIVVFQIFHYKKPMDEINTAQYYYRQYMDELEGNYSIQTEEYLQREKERYDAIRLRLEELHQKMNAEGLNAKENSELQKLQQNQKGEEGYRMAVQRVKHVKKYKDAEIFDDLSLQRLFCEGRIDTIIDFSVSFIFALIFAGLLCFEERVYDLKCFLSAMPGYRKIRKNKQRLILIVCAFLSLMAVLPKTIAIGMQMGYSGMTAPAYSTAYFPQLGIPVWSVLVLVFLIYYMVSSIIAIIVLRIFE